MAHASDQKTAYKQNRDTVPQALVDTQPIRLPVVEGKDIRFTHLSATEGLSQVRVAQIVQDDQGFLWFGTQVGLNRYDGYKFKVFTHDPARPNSLSGTFVYSLFKGRSGEIWVGSDQSFDKLDPSTESFTHFHIDHPDPIVSHISQDSVGMLWLSTETGLYRFNPATGQSSHFGHDPNDLFSLSGDNIQSTGEDRSGKFWVMTDAGLDAFDRATGKTTFHIPLPESAHGSLCSIACRSFYEDRFGVFWIIYDSDSGLAVFDPSTKRLTKYSFYEPEPSGVASTGVNAILEDHHGTMWFGTMGGGVLKFDRAHHRFIRYRRYPNDPDSLAENRVIALFEDREGNIWAGFHAMAPDSFAEAPSPFEQFRLSSADPGSLGENLVNAIYEDQAGTLWMGAGGSLIAWDRKTGHYTRYNPEGKGVDTEVLAILEDRSGVMWIGTLGRGLSRFDRKTGQFKTYRHQSNNPSSLSNDTVTRLFVNHAGTMWAATWDGLNRFDPATGRFSVYKRDPSSTEPYFSIMEDRKECLWLGSKSGLVRFCPETSRFTTFQHDPANPNSLSNNSLDSVYQDHSGAIWLGTQDGLNRLDPETNSFTSYYTKDGLPGNAVSCILGDDQNLWMSTNNGVSRFNLSTRTFKNYSVADGLPGNDMTGWDACFQSTRGEMSFGGFGGAVAFRPDSIPDGAYAPPVVFTDFRLSGAPVKIGPGSTLKRAITHTHSLTLSHQQASFSLEFSALSFRSPATNRYRYKLDGLDSEWHEIGSQQRVVNYTALPAGTYVFRVQSGTSRSAWSEPSTDLRISILPAWWATWWFRSLCVGVILLLAYAAYSYRMRQIARQFEVRLFAEEQVRRSEAFLAEAQHLARIGSFCWRVAIDEITWSEQLYRIFEMPQGTPITLEVIGLRVHPEDIPMLNDMIDRARSGASDFEYAHRLLMPDGAIKYVHLMAHAVRDHEGLLEYIGAVQDVTQRRLSEEALSRARSELTQVARIMSLGVLTASIAHEVNQPLSGIITNASTCLRMLSADPPNLEGARETTRRAIRDGNRASNVIARLRNLFSRKDLQPEWMDLNEATREVASLSLSDLHRNRIILRVELAEDLPPVVGDRIQLQQVMLNLVRNASDAMSTIDGRPRELLIKTERDGDDYVSVSVKDSGVGFSAPSADKLFEAFYTTKTDGMGIGLSISRSIIEAHRGRLWAKPNDGPGATFCFAIPCKAEGAADDTSHNAA